jgi:hypothetical protein
MVGTPSATTLSMKHKKLPKLLHKNVHGLDFLQMYLFDYFPKNSFETNKKSEWEERKRERKKREIEMYFNFNNKPQQLE